MAEDGSDNQNVSMSVPIGVVATSVLLGLAAAVAYIILGRSDQSVTGAPGQAARSGRSMMRRVGLMTLITLIENDTTRRVVVAALRAMARRA
jgi:hypothetical protein